MPGTVVWFVLLVVAMAGAWFAGSAVTRIQDPLRRGCVVGGALLLLLTWTALIRHPAVAVNILPLSVLARLEGVGAAPLFVFILGVGWRLAVVRRQRAVMLLGMCLCAAYVLQGGLWMMRPTPTNAFQRTQKRILVHQTQDYSCVPAASATALRLLGHAATEEEMARLTETRPGSGATLLRALNGLERRLRHAPLEPRLLAPDYEQLQRIEPPMLTPLQYQTARLHMVTILEVRPHLVVVADPQAGIEFIPRRAFLSYYRGQVIAFDGKAERLSAQHVLARYSLVQDPDLYGQAAHAAD